MSARDLYHPKSKEFSKQEEIVFAQEELIVNVTEDILVAMEDQNISKKQLADELGTSQAHVSQLLNGSRNMTLRTLATISHVLGLQSMIHFSSLQEVAAIKKSKPYVSHQSANHYVNEPAVRSEKSAVKAKK